MRNSPSWPRGGADQTQEGQRWRNAVAGRPYMRPDTPRPVLDMEVDVRDGDLEGTVRIVAARDGASTRPVGRLGNELDLVDRATADVFRSVARPFTLQTRLDDRLVVSTSIRARQDVGGSWTLVSHRERDGDFELEDARHETLLGRLAAAALGARHVRETRDELGTSSFMRNLGMLAPFRSIVPTLPQRARAARLLGHGGAVALGDLADLLHPVPTNGLAIAYALTLRRCVAIDMEAPMGRDSVVRAVVPPRDPMPGLFERLRAGRTSA